MSAKDFKFVSPGVFIEEIDNSQLPKLPVATGPLVIGRTRRGPAFQPVRVDSFSEFVTIFGNPVGGDEGSDKWRFGVPSAPTFAAYAAQAWLKNSSPITVIRLLGDQSPDAGTGATAKAGWKSADLSSGVGGGAYGLFLFNSASSAQSGAGAESVSGTLAAVFYSTEGAVTLSGSVRRAPAADADIAATANNTATLVYSADGTFTAEVFDGTNTSPVSKEKTSFNFTRGSNQYIRKVFNTDPVLTNSQLVDSNTTSKTYWLGQTFEREVQDKISSTGQYGMILALGKSTSTIANGADFKFASKGSKTGWFFSQDLRNTVASGTPSDNAELTPAFNPENLSTVTRLFKIHSISTGEDVQRDYKISIEDLKYSKNDNTPYGSFSLAIRDVKDTDNARKYVERFTNLTLDPSSPNYIAKQIGDKYFEWDSDARRLIEYGNYDNRSSIVRVAMASAVDNGSVDPELLPFGVEGPLKMTDFDLISVDTGAKATAADKLSAAAQFADGKAFSITLPANCGGTGTTITFTSKATMSDPAANNIHVLGGVSATALVDNLVLAFNGTDDTTKVRYGAGAGSQTDGFLGLTAAEGTSDTKVTLTAVRSGAVINGAGHGAVVDGTLLDATVNFSGGSQDSANFTTGRITTTSDVTAGTGSAGLYLAATGSGTAGTGVRLQYELSSLGHVPFTGSVTFPSIALRLSASDGDLGDPTDAYFGATVTRSTASVIYEDSISDLVYPLPSGGPDAPTANVAKTSWYFSMDDLMLKEGTKNLVYYVSGSRALGDSITARTGSYKAVLDKGYDRFTTPLYGGFNGLDITEKEPFNDSRALIEGATETDYAMFYSAKKAIDMFSDPEFIEANILSAPGIVNQGLTTHMLTTCESRGDSMAIIDPRGGYKPSSENADSEQTRITQGAGRGGVSNHVLQVANNMEERNLNSSYGATYYPWVRISDTISGQNLWVPPSVAALGALSYSENQSALWFAPAGFNRGGLSGGAAGIPVTNVRSRLTSAERDYLYERNVNPIASLPNEGIVIFGQKTLQVTPSALDRINVRRLMIFVKKEISRIASTLLFDQNVEQTWSRFTGQVGPFLTNIQNNFGLSDFRVILDDTTTTPDLIDRNTIYAKIFLKPAKAVEFFAIDFVITNSGAGFED
jgi:hypothetical protein